MSSETLSRTGSHHSPHQGQKRTRTRANALAERLEQGAQALLDLASTLTDAQWQTPVSARDRRKIGVVVHHVASVYPVEIQLAQVLADGKPVVDVTKIALAFFTALGFMVGMAARMRRFPSTQD